MIAHNPQTIPCCKIMAILEFSTESLYMTVRGCELFWCFQTVDKMYLNPCDLHFGARRCGGGLLAANGRSRAASANFAPPDEPDFSRYNSEFREGRVRFLQLIQ